MQKFKILLLFVICHSSFVILAGGCAGVKETAKGIIGISTRELENSRVNALKKVFTYGYETCYNKTLQALKQMGAYIYATDKKENMVAIYVSETDTTAAGIYFKEIDANDTQVEVSSPSAYAKEYIAKGLFAWLEKSPN